MMVTKIQDISKNRYQVWLDGEVAFVLYKGDLRHYGVREGEELDEETYRKLQDDVLRARAEKRALHLLEKRDYTTAGLKRKLVEGGYSKELAQAAADRMESYHYLDDERYADRYLRCYAGRKTKRAIYNKLMEKGIARDILEKIFEQYEAEGNETDENDMAVNLLKKRHYEGEPAEKKVLERHIAFLVRRGFSVSCARQAVSNLQREYEKTNFT